MEDLEKSEQEQAYRDYIKEHLMNNLKAYENNISLLTNILDLSAEDINTIETDTYLHDSSKYGYEEFDAYRIRFNTTSLERKMMESNPQLEQRWTQAYKNAWLHHMNTNKHHWNYWILRDGKGYTPVDMPNVYIAEMLIDWIAMAYKFGGMPQQYYSEHKDTILLSPNTRALLENIVKHDFQ